MGIKITQALAELHDEKVAHLDLKPSNIIYNRKTKKLKLSDLNIAQKIPVSASGNFRGTPAYVSPEQTGRMGNSLLDHRSDLYSLGVTFYELLTGKPHLFFVSVYPNIYLPFSNIFISNRSLFSSQPTSGGYPFNYEDKLQMIQAHVTQEAKPVHFLRPDVPKSLSGIITKLMQKVTFSVIFSFIYRLCLPFDLLFLFI